jgi:hypothetical protein
MTADEMVVIAVPASRNRAVTVPTAERNFVAGAKGSCERAWHLRTSTSIVMCASEQIHLPFSSIDYDLRRDFCVFEYRGKISVTLTVTLLRDGCALEQLH